MEILEDSIDLRLMQCSQAASPVMALKSLGQSGLNY